MLVPPIAAYLAWRRRTRVVAAARKWGWGLGVAALGLLLYPVGVFAAVEFLPELSLVAALGGFMLYFLGPGASKLIAFPYGFLYFMIPWPDTLVETLSFPMQLLSARFAAMLAGLSGVSVQRDGVDLHTPGYSLSVAAPCSGMKSLVALLALSALVAYIASGPRWKRWGLFAAGLPLALVSNVGRILCVLLIAEVAGAEAAAGFFHGFSGVLVFLFATLGILAIARAAGLQLSSGREGAGGGPEGPPATGIRSPRGDAPPAGSRRFVIGPAMCLAPMALVVLTHGLVIAAGEAGQNAASAAPDFAKLPMVVGEWQGRDVGPLDDLSEQMLRPDAYVVRDYVHSDGYPVSLSVIFGHEKDTFHSPGFCLLGSGWSMAGKRVRSLRLNGAGEVVRVNELLVQRRDERRLTVYWYASSAETTPSWAVFQWRLLRNRLLDRETGGALVRLDAPVIESEAAASQTIQHLIQELYPHLTSAVGI